MENTDKSLLDSHRQGNSTAFAELVRRYGNSLLGYLMRMCGNREQAEDFFQETFKRVHEKAHALRSEQFKPWLFTIATRVAIDGLKRRKRLQVISLNQKVDCAKGQCEELGTVAVADTLCEPSQEAVRAEQKEQVRLAIESLPDRQRATLVLAYYEQLSYKEVAEVLGCSVGTVKTQMYRALKTLSQRLPDISDTPDKSE
jgi:RNA polymerase sigma-70 factor (ECF subfamily)